jgi:hypothetical protein
VRHGPFLGKAHLAEALDLNGMQRLDKHGWDGEM